MADLEKIKFKDLTGEQLMRYNFFYHMYNVGFMLYNKYGCLGGFYARESKVVRNVNGEIIQQTFICHQEGIRDEKYINSAC